MRLILRSCFTVGFSALAALALGSASIAGAVPAGGAVQARLSADLRPLAAPPTSVIYGPACPDVMVIAARGTGEAPSPDWQDLSAYVSDPNHGAGATLFSLYTDMNNANGLTFSLDPVVYPVAPPTSSLTNPLGVLIHSSQQYLGDAAIGAEGIALDIQNTDATCHHTVHYILAGYSLGAWAVHDALLHQLDSKEIIHEIAGVALFGDPKFIPSQTIVREDKLLDIQSGIATVLPGDDSIPPKLVPHTGSWCVPTDPICQARCTNLVCLLACHIDPACSAVPAETAACIAAVSVKPALTGICAHLQYPTDGATEAAAVFLQPFLPPGSGSSGGGNTAEEVPGLGTLNTGGNAEVLSVSCGSAGNCSAGGQYESGGTFEGFVVDETNGTWDTAEEVPGLAALGEAADASVNSVSCRSAGNCSAGGQYTDTSGHEQAFVANETGGSWGSAVEVPGTASLNTGGNAGAVSVSCGSAGNCSAGGYYTDVSGHTQGFVVNETNGSWGAAEEAPGLAGLEAGGGGVINLVSCGSAGNCSAGGYYFDSSNNDHVLVVDESNGSWGTAEEVPGTAALDFGDLILIRSLSCASAGNCSAGGYYLQGLRAFVVDETNGTWGTAQEVPGLATLSSPGNAAVTSVSCGSAGNCSAGGDYTDSSGHVQAFVADETSGTWGDAEEVPGTAALNVGGDAQIGAESCASEGNCTAVSCASAGNCATGGFYTDGSGHEQVFVIDETNGAWGTAVESSGIAALNLGGAAGIYSVSCGSAGNCSAGGQYKDSGGDLQAFVINGI